MNNKSHPTLYVQWAIPLLCLALTSGCGVMANGRGWGQDATLAPGWDRLGQAAWDALAAPATWAPLAGAVALQSDRADKDIQRWAAKNTPVYGTQRNADKMSDNLMTAAGALWALSGAAAPSGNDFGEWTLNKTRAFSVEVSAGIVTRGLVGIGKGNTHRPRPNDANKESLPSAHATGTTFYTSLASRHVDTYGWPAGAVTASRIALGTLTTATAWARVEANQHYPSDVLAGIALGHFMGAFITNAFIGADNPRQVMPILEGSRDGVMVGIAFDF